MTKTKVKIDKTPNNSQNTNKEIILPMINKNNIKILPIFFKENNLKLILKSMIFIKFQKIFQNNFKTKII